MNGGDGGGVLAGIGVDGKERVKPKKGYK